VWWETIAATDFLAYFLSNMCAKHYENPTMLFKVTAKNVGDVFLRHTVDMEKATSVITPVLTYSSILEQFIVH